LQRKILINKIIKNQNILVSKIIESYISNKYGYILYKYIHNNIILWNEINIKNIIEDMAILLYKLHQIKDTNISDSYFGSSRKNL